MARRPSYALNMIYKTVGIVGAGSMSCGIAQLAAQAGSIVKRMDVQEGLAEQARRALCGQ